MNDNQYPLVNHSRDPPFLTLCSLQTSRGRRQTGLYVIEGIRHLARALEHNAPTQSIFVEPSALANPFGKKLARRLRTTGVPGIRLSHQLYRDLTLAHLPQGIRGVVQQKWSRVDQVDVEADSLCLAIESMESPRNLGTIIRTAEAAGVGEIFLLGADCDVYDPGTVRSTMGSLFSQTFIQCSSNEFTNWARSKVAVIASSPSGLMDYKALRYRFPAVLVIGSEKRGLSGQLLEVSDFQVRIPMQGSCDSINAAVATGSCCSKCRVSGSS